MSQSSSTTTSQQQTTFRTTIDFDHDTIQHLAGRLCKAYEAQPTTPESIFVSIKEELVWRLIRHDNSEELVMRPAFIHYLGAEGEQYVNGDRHDHGDAKQQLIPLLPLSPTSTEYKSVIVAILDELKGHMDRESGHEIPRFESLLSPLLSRRLAMLYEKTQILTPQITWAQLRDARQRDGNVDSFDELKPGGDENKVFEDLKTYVFTSSERMRELLGWSEDLMRNLDRFAKAGDMDSMVNGDLSGSKGSRL